MIGLASAGADSAMDLFVVSTIGFDLLYVLVIVRLARARACLDLRDRIPTAEWIARQITEAFARMPMARNRRVGLGGGDRATYACSAHFRQASHRAPVLIRRYPKLRAHRRRWDFR